MAQPRCEGLWSQEAPWDHVAWATSLALTGLKGRRWVFPAADSNTHEGQVQAPLRGSQGRPTGQQGPSHRPSRLGTQPPLCSGAFLAGRGYKVRN